MRNSLRIFPIEKDQKPRRIEDLKVAPKLKLAAVSTYF